MEGWCVFFLENWVGWMVGWLDGLGFSCFLNDLGVIPLKQMALKLFGEEGCMAFTGVFWDPVFLVDLWGPF